MLAGVRLASLIGPVPRGIGGTKKRDEGCAYRRREMQRPGVATNSALGTA
jgi:hypothetical protein